MWLASVLAPHAHSEQAPVQEEREEKGREGEGEEKEGGGKRGRKREKMEIR